MTPEQEARLAAVERDLAIIKAALEIEDVATAPADPVEAAGLLFRERAREAQRVRA